MTNPTHAEALAAIEKYLVASTLELFVAYEMDLTEEAGASRTSESDGELIAAVIGYVAEGIRGSLGLISRATVVRAWQPGGSDASEETVRDTIGEFSNMLLGRLKNRLLPHGVAIQVATPMTAIGRELRFLSAPRGLSIARHFGGHGGPVDVRFDVTFDPSFAFAEEAMQESTAATEGDLMLF
jgi:CheY-specific phosphatase CheX